MYKEKKPCSVILNSFAKDQRLQVTTDMKMLVCIPTLTSLRRVIGFELARVHGK